MANFPFGIAMRKPSIRSSATFVALLSVFGFWGCSEDSQTGDQALAMSSDDAAVAATDDAEGDASLGNAETEDSLSAIDGKAVYMKHCATCHMADGRGVPSFQPGIVDSPIVTGELETLEAVIWAGSAYLGTIRENPTGHNMPPFGYLSGEEVKALALFVKENFSEDSE